MADVQTWVSLPRNFELEKSELELKEEPCDDHPLSAKNLPVVETEKPKVTQDSVEHPLGFDPLNGFQQQEANGNPLDPLSVGAANNDPSNGVEFGEEIDPFEGFAPWATKKSAILQKYTTKESIMLPDFMAEGAPQVAMPVDQVKHRLEQLGEDDDKEAKMLQLTQQEYIRHINELHEDMQDAWSNEKRVKTLKISIKCAKLLGDTAEVTAFYPSKFVLISEILDTFGKLVFQRIKMISTVYVDDAQIPLKDNFRAEDVADHAKETCKNWFFKIASIRELLPRLYVEMSILSCYRFIANDRIKSVIDRLNQCIRGIGDPLVATYARVYLARKAHECLPRERDFLRSSFDDYIFLQKHMEEDYMNPYVKDRNVTRAEYLDLYAPGLDWLLQCIAYKLPRNMLNAIIADEEACKNPILLNAIISAFLPQDIVNNGKRIVQLIKNSDSEVYSKMELYRTLGITLVLAVPPKADRTAILKEIWGDVTLEDDPEKFIRVAEIYIEYPVKHCTRVETNMLLGDIIKHVQEDRKYLDFQPQLQSIMQKVLGNYEDFGEVFAMDNFLPFMDIFRGEIEVEVSKSILRSFSRHQGVVTDPIIISTMFRVAKIAHDSVSALSFDDEVRQISGLINRFIDRMSFSDNLDKRLNFYVECRRAFANLDAVKGHLVLGACDIAARTHKLVNGKHNSKTSAFVRAVISFCFITIPSMEDIFLRLHLYNLSAQMALLNQSLPQADSLIKGAITLIQEVPAAKKTGGGSLEERAVGIVQQFGALLIAVPGHPEYGPFYLLKGLLKVVSDLQWDHPNGVKFECYVSILTLLAAAAQETLPYHFPKVDANDILYYGTEEFSTEVSEMIGETLSLIQKEIEALADYPDTLVQKKLANACIILVNTALAYTKLSTKAVAFIDKIYVLGKEKKVGGTALKATRSYLKWKIEHLSNKTDATPEQLENVPHYEELLKKMRSYATRKSKDES